MLADLNILQILMAVFGIGALIAWHELGHYWVARMTGMRVLKYSIGFGPTLLSFVRNNIKYQIAALPFGGFVHIFGMTPYEEGAAEDPRAYINRPRWARILTILAGPAFNYILAVFLFWGYHAFVPVGAYQVTDVAADSPLAAQVQKGDLIDRAGGRVRSDEQLTTLSQKGATKIRVIRSEGESIKSEIIVVDATSAPLGLSLNYVEQERGVVDAVSKSFSDTYTLSAKTLQALPGLFASFSKMFRAPDEVSGSGPVGIVAELKTAAKRGAGDFLWLLAYLSVTLGLLNLLPVPALDGIKILFLGIESILRRDINPGVQVWVNAIGAILLFGLILLLSVNDVIKLFT